LHELCTDALSARFLLHDHILDLPFIGNSNDAGTEETQEFALAVFAFAFRHQEARAVGLTLNALPVVIWAPMRGTLNGLFEGKDRREVVDLGGANGVDWLRQTSRIGFGMVWHVDLAARLRKDFSV
jgi:hypothetical protein